MNIIERRKSQLRLISNIILVIATILAIVGLALIITCGFGKDLSVAKLVVGIVLMVLSLCGFAFGIYLSCITSALKATKGSVAEENLGHGTVNMNKCSNCGAEVKKGEELCNKCKEDLK